MLATILRALASWTAANPNLAIGVLVAILSLTANGLARWGHFAGLVGVLGKIVDLLSPFTRRDASGTFKAPFTFSKLAEQAAAIGSAGSIPPAGKVAIAVFLFCGTAQASSPVNLVRAPDAPAITSPAPTASAVPVLLPPTLPDLPLVVVPQSDPLARIAALEAALSSVKTASGMPATIPPSFWTTTPGQVLSITFAVATIVVTSVGTAAGAYTAFK